MLIVSVPSPKCICSASSDCVFYHCYHTMSTFIHCSKVGVISVYPQIRKIIQSAFVSCDLYHHDVKVIVYDGCVDCRGLFCPCAFQGISLMCVAALCVPFVVVDRPEVEDV